MKRIITKLIQHISFLLKQQKVYGRWINKNNFVFFKKKESKEWTILILLLYQKNSQLIKNEIKKTGNRIP